MSFTHTFASLTLLLATSACAIADAPLSEPPSTGEGVAAPHDAALSEPAGAPGDPHLWVVSPFAVAAVHHPTSGAVPGERWFFGPLEDTTWSRGRLWLALGSGALVAMDGSLLVQSVLDEGVPAPIALAAAEDDLYVADAERGLLELDGAGLDAGRIEVLAHRPDVVATTLAPTPHGLAAVVPGPGAGAILHLDPALETVGRWWRSSGAPAEGLAHAEGQLHLVDGGPCVLAFDAPASFEGAVNPSAEVCHPGRRYHAIEVDAAGTLFLAHDDGVDIYRDLDALRFDPETPLQVIVDDAWPRWAPHRLAVGTAP